MLVLFSHLTYFAQLSYHFLMPEIMNLAAESQECHFIIDGNLNNKKALLSQRRPRDAPNIWVP